MAVEAISHYQIYGAHGHRLAGHIAMAARAAYFGANVGRVIEFNVRRGIICIDTLPGNFFTAGEVPRNFFDFGVVCSNYLMTGHTKLNARNTRDGALLDAGMAVSALYALSKMHVMREGDWLDGFNPPAEKILDRIGDAAMSRGIDRWALRRGLGWLATRRRPGEQNH
jgi:hypothetical protein